MRHSREAILVYILAAFVSAASTLILLRERSPASEIAGQPAAEVDVPGTSAAAPAAVEPEASVEEIPEEAAMKFRLFEKDLRPRFNLHQFVFADGVLVSGTSERFIEFVKANNIKRGARVFLNSPGGLMSEGMLLGEAFRTLGMNTDVGIEQRKGTKGTKTASQPQCTGAGDASEFQRCMYQMPQVTFGNCESACALAYIGGTYRFLEVGSRIGVHRFYGSRSSEDDLDKAQVLSGVILKYISEMGVDPRLFEKMTLAAPEDMHYLSRSELSELRVYTGSTKTESWQFKSMPGSTYLVGTKEDERGEAKFIVGCYRPNRKLMLMGMIPVSTDEMAKQVEAEASDVGYFLDAEVETVSGTGRDVKVYAEGQSVRVSFELSKVDVEKIVGARSTGIAVLPKDQPGVFSGFTIDVEGGRKHLSNYSQECWDISDGASAE
jgi:hypothetical protein